jgi:hypothetical protein
MATPNVKVEIVDSLNSVSVIENPVVVEIGFSGPQGPKGESVTAEDVSYVHTQSVASSTWTITHGLNFIPNITVVDSGGTVVEGSYNYPSATTVVASFSGVFAGKAYLS